MELENQELQLQKRTQTSKNESYDHDRNQEESFRTEEEVNPKGYQPTLEEFEQLKQQLDQYQALVQQLKKQADENHEQMLRARADLENSRRRFRKEKEVALKYAAVPLLESLLPVLDNFERALDAADQSEHHQGLQEGVEMVYRQFLGSLSQAGLSLIEAEGKPFDPHQHNAVMLVPVEGVEPGLVVEEVQSGYRFLDRVIRPSMVKISN
ncbi:nucleotide exchange factor GrpE [Hazenella coriacea]|uniref:Protein GrpE n=1 Tax=Hazenella coriacea TaxID=1179467 RepID=A0A4R3L6X1_9BACL|nr:nucleotide exchange factor GrpE [Hazenella coriacea]TCS94775.1 molecular chaperone GrpE [Hazenella coriacea]